MDFAFGSDLMANEDASRSLIEHAPDPIAVELLAT